MVWWSRGGGLIGMVLVSLAACTDKTTDSTDDSDSEETEVVDSDSDTEDSEPEDTEPLDTDTDDTEQVDTEEADTEPVDSEVIDSDSETDDTDDTVVVDTETDDTVVVDTEIDDTEIDDTEIDDTEIVDTEIVDTEIDDTEIVDTEIVDTEVEGGPTTVQEINQGVHAAGALIELEEMHVMGILSDGVYVSRTGGGPQSSILVHLSPGDAPFMYINRILRIVGVVVEETTPWGVVRSIDTTVPGGSTLQIGNNSGPAPVPFTIAQAIDPVTAAPYQAGLIVITAPRVWEDASDVYYIGDSTATLAVSREIVLGGDRSYGDTWTSLTGVLAWRNGRWELLPRRSADLVGYLQDQTGADQLAYGDVVISELMEVPAASVTGASCSAAATSGQYVEIYNAAGHGVDLDGLIYYDFMADGQSQLRQSMPLAAGDRVVAFVGGDANCYGVDADFQIAPPLSGSGNFVGLFNHTIMLDQLVAFSFPRTSGVAHELSESNLTADDNDAAGNWCASATTIPGSAALGTPGEVNDCP
jgi:hypothetical protein